MDGDWPVRSATVRDSLRRSSSPDRTLTARGVDCSSRSPVFDAVTTILLVDPNHQLEATLTVAPFESRTRFRRRESVRPHAQAVLAVRKVAEREPTVRVRRGSPVDGPTRPTAALAIRPPVGSSTEPAIAPV